MSFRPKIKNLDGTYTDFPLAAETTVKLKNSRSIGLSGVVATAKNFDGTSDITIPITDVPGSLLSGSTSISTSGNAATATLFSNMWIEFTPSSSLLAFGVYLVKVDIADNSSGIGNYGTVITDVITMLSNSAEEYEYRSYDYPSGPLHMYVANDYEATLYRSARIKVVNHTAQGFRLNLYVSILLGSASSDISGNQLYPERLASLVNGISYKMKFKRIM